jgi:signal peptidase I
MPRTAAASAAASQARRREWATLALFLLLLALTRTSLANHYQVPSGSMEPNLRPGDRVVVNMLAYGLRVPFTDIELIDRGEPQRGDVVVFKSPDDGTRLIKRVVAVGGDQVALIDGRLWIDGQPLHDANASDIEHFGDRDVPLDLRHGGGPDIFDTTVPQGMALVLGDHRGNSRDGRYFGLVPMDSLYGKAVAVYWRSGEGPGWTRL